MRLALCALVLSLTTVAASARADTCGAYTCNPVTYCGGTVFASAKADDGTRLAFWDRAAEWVGAWLTGMKALAIYGPARVPTDAYATGKAGGGCTAAAIGPYTILTAAHCHDLGAITAGVGSWGATPFIKEGDATPYGIYRYVTTPDRILGNPASSAEDIMIGYRDPSLPPIPPPYFDPSLFYDWTTEAANCTGLLRQGYGGSGDLSECDYGIDLLYEGWEGTLNSAPFGLHQCQSPAGTVVGSGDSGGPTYAFVDADGPGGADPIVKLAEIDGGVLDSYISGWISNNYPAPNTPIATFGSGLSIDNVRTQYDPYDPEAITLADIDLPCVMELSSTGAPVAWGACVFQNPSGQTKSCRATEEVGGEYRCTVTFPKNSGQNWRWAKLLVADTAGNVEELDEAGMYRGGMTGLRAPLYTSPSPTGIFDDKTAPMIANENLSASVEPGGQLVCQAQVTAAGVETLMFGCALESVSYANKILCYEKDPEPISTGWNQCTALVPGDVPLGSTWGVDVFFAKDRVGNTGGRASAKTMTAFDCGSSGYNLQAAGAGWTTALPIDEAHQDATIEFYAKPNNAGGGMVALGSESLVDLGEAAEAIRFAPSGFIEVLSNGVWTADHAVPWRLGQWHHFRILAQAITYITGVVPHTYSVHAGWCGGPMKLVQADASGTGSRIYSGLGLYNAADFVDVLTPTVTNHYCFPTQCVYESPTWNCGDPPNGCGGLAGCAADCSASPGTTCGGDPAYPWICGTAP